jgi:hypothetical protein
MPNVRASSGMIGTQRLPMPLSFMRSLSRRTKAIVVATFCLPEPRLMSPNAGESGMGRGLAFVRRDGTVAAQRLAPLLEVGHLLGVLAQGRRRAAGTGRPPSFESGMSR